MLLERRSLTYSILFHTGLLLVAAFGLPALLPDKIEPTPMVMSIEVLPIGEITNVKPSDKPITEEKHAPVAKAPKEIAPPPKQQAAPPKEEKHFDPMEKAEAAPSEKPKLVEKPPEKPKEVKNNDTDFNKVLADLTKEANAQKVKDAKDTTNTEANKTTSNAPYDASLPLSMSELDAIRSQISANWRMPIGAKDAKNLVVWLQIKMQPDGSVGEVALVSDQQARYMSEPFFRAAADSAIAAVHKSSPLKNLPADKYNTWGSIKMSFTPPDM